MRPGLPTLHGNLLCDAEDSPAGHKAGKQLNARQRSTGSAHGLASQPTLYNA